MSFRYSPEFLEQIRNRVPLSSIVGKSVIWDKHKTKIGRGDFWCRCPFVVEKTPSFHADDRKGRYHCFGCGASGDVFRWLTDKQGMTFGEAVEALASEAGLQLPKASAETIKRETRRRTLAEIVEAAARFYEDRLWGGVGQAARDYLAQRGVNTALAKRFRLGLAPDARSDLKQHLAKLGVSNDDMAEAGLIKTSEKSPVPYDVFRDRLMVPVVGDKDQVLGFSGRYLGSRDDAPKYLNSPATPLFDKGRLLFNGPAARKAAWDAGATVVVVEGNFDCITAVGAGFEAATAPLGTATTDEQMLLLWRMSNRPIFCFDGDKAGQEAMGRAIDVALPLLLPGRSIALARCPTGADPDSVIRERGPEAFGTIISLTQTLAEAIWRSEAGTGLSDPDAVSAARQRIKDRLSTIKDPAVRRAYLDDMDARFRAVRKPKALYRSNGTSNHSVSPSSIRLAHGYQRGGMGLKEAVMVAACAGAPETALACVETLTGPLVCQLVEALATGALGGLQAAIEEAQSVCRQAGLMAVANGDPAACEAMIRGS